MPNIDEIQDQIKVLKEREAEILSQEVSGVIDEIKEKMVRYKITVADLHKSLHATSVKAETVEKTKKAPIKYRNDETGDSWSGRGLKPRWLTKLIDSGRSMQDFYVG